MPAAALSHLLALCLGLLVIVRVDEGSARDPLAWVAWSGCWLLTVVGLDRVLRSVADRWLPVILVSLLACWVVFWGLSPSVRCWHFAIIVYVAGAGLLIQRGWRHATGLNGRPVGESIRWLALALLCLGVLHPFLTSRLVGGGDAQGYALQLADFTAQLHAGVFPVLVGQSAHAFNGDIHPLRTAPGFLYAGGLLDCLTLFSLSAVALQNLLVVIAGFAGTFGTYLALTRLVPGHGWTGCLLAALFITCPGVLAPVYSGDMIATWTTLPWLPWLLLAFVRMADAPSDLAGPVRVSALLAVLWLFHAPIGFWCSLCALPFGLRFLLAGRLDRTRLFLVAGLAGLFLLLSGYVFAAVLTLDMPADPNLRDAINHGAILASLNQTWASFGHPVSPGANALLSDLQLSPGLWVAFVLGVLGLFRREARTSDRLLVLVAVLLVALLLPASDILWRNLPDIVLSTTEKWPAQRFFPILSVLAAFLVMPVFASMRTTHRRLVRDLTVLLAVAWLWSAVESAKFVRRGHNITHAADHTRQLLLPGNASLSRYAHEYYGRLPRYFSNGPVDPSSQLRLLDRDSLEPILANSRALLERPAGSPDIPCRLEVTDYGGRYLPALAIDPGARYLLHFDFHGRRPEGVIQIAGRHMNREYRLPDSGEERAFGVGPGRDSTLTLWNATDQPDLVEIRLLYSQAPDKSAPLPTVRVIPFASARLPLELTSLIPLAVRVDSPSPAWLETPRLHVPGYQATVNGASVPIASSPDGLVMLPVPAGRAEVRLSYPGPAILRPVFWLSALAWLVLGLSDLRTALPRIRFPDLPSAGFLSNLGRITLAAGTITLLAIASSALLQKTAKPSAIPAGSDLNIAVRFSYGRPLGTVEKLITLEVDGRAVDFLATYTDGKKASIGYQLPGAQPVFSNSFPVNYLLPQQVEIRSATGAGTGREIRINHRLVLSLPAAH